MLYLIIIILALDIVLMYLNLKDETKINNSLKKIINKLNKTLDNLNEDLDNANFRVEQRDNLIKDLKEEKDVLIETIADLKNKKELVDVPNQN